MRLIDTEHLTTIQALSQELAIWTEKGSAVFPLCVDA